MLDLTKTTAEAKAERDARLAQLIEEQRSAYPNISEEAVRWSAERRLMWEQVK